MSNQRETLVAINDASAMGIAATNQVYHDVVANLSDKYSELARDISGVNAGVAQAIDKKLKEEQETFENEHKESLKELLDLLCNTSNKDFYDDKGEAIPLSELGKKAQLINKVIHKAIGTGENAKIIIEYEFIPKEKIIDMLMKRYGLYKAE